MLNFAPALLFLERYGAPSTFSWRPIHAVASIDGKFGCTTGFCSAEQVHLRMASESGRSLGVDPGSGVVPEIVS